MYSIAVIPGDGTGPEVIAEGLKVLDAVSKKCGFQYKTTQFDFGGRKYIDSGVRVTLNHRQCHEPQFRLT